MMNEIKKEIISKKPYKKWVNENVLPLVDIPYTNNNIPTEATDYKTRLRLFGYTTEEISTIISSQWQFLLKKELVLWGQTLL